MKKSIQITVEKSVLLKARSKAMGMETVISHIIEGYLKLWVDGKLADPKTLARNAHL
jgi:hypothetical protein